MRLAAREGDGHRHGGHLTGPRQGMRRTLCSLSAYGVRKGPPDPAIPVNPVPLGRLLGPHSSSALRRWQPMPLKVEDSRGRFYPETESATRSCYSRDRDRIIHSTAFRRLKHKTQVFVEHEGDHYRTRLTHSLEVAQLARSLARSFQADEDLAEAVALAHDLGHTPFGHAGEEALTKVAADIGGFDHNAHALRLVTKLEHRYAEFRWPQSNLGNLGRFGQTQWTNPAARAWTDPQASMPAGRSIFPAGPGSKPRSRHSPMTSPMSIMTSMMVCVPACFFPSTGCAMRLWPAPHVQNVIARYGELELTRFIRGVDPYPAMSALLDDLQAETSARLAAVKPNSAAAQVRAAFHAHGGAVARHAGTIARAQILPPPPICTGIPAVIASMSQRAPRPW